MTMPTLVPVSRLQPHALADQVPEMRPAEWRAFLADVAERGILEPVRLAPDGFTVLDGRHRLRAALELELAGLPTAPAMCEPGDEAAYMIRAALHRRHLSDDQRAMLAVRLSAELGADQRRLRAQKAAQARWSGTPDDACVPPPPTQASDHPSRAEASRALGISTQRFESARKLAATAPDLAAQVEAGDMPLLVAKTQAQRRDALAELASATPAIVPKGAEVWQGDFRELAPSIPDGSVDLVLTDPPYGTEFLGLWPDLGRLAYRVLKPGAFCLAYVGHLHLPAELAGLAAGGLEYWWQACIRFQGSQPGIPARRVRTGWRPVLILVKPPVPESPPWFSDCLQMDPMPEKRYHEWGQSLGPPRQLLRRFSPAGGLVLDPCCGSGTFPLAALLEGRRALGIELDPGHAEVVRRRLAQAAGSVLGALEEGR